MLIDCEWWDDPELYIVIASGTEHALRSLVYSEGVPHLSEDNLSIYDSHVSQLRAKKSAWYKLDSFNQSYISTFCSGFAIGYDHGQYA